MVMLEALDYTPIPSEYNGLRAEVRSFLNDQLTGLSTEDRAHSWQGFDKEFSRKLARRGLVGLTLPKAYGGAELGAFARFVVVEELLCAGAPVAAHWIADRQSGPLILRYGSEDQKKFYLNRICKAEAFFCIGMSEPNSGSDLASVRTRAERCSNGWLLNGQKVWTTYAHYCDYMIALVRTSGTSDDRHQGLSQVIVDLKSPGVEVRPIRDLTGTEHFSEVFFNDVLLSPEALVGQEGAGWAQVTAELAFERSGPERIYSSIVLMDIWIAWLRERGERRYLSTIGRLAADLATLRALSIAITAKLALGESPVIEAALVKDLGTTFEQDLPLIIADAVGADTETAPAPLRRTLAYLCQICPAFSLRGGTREILRGMIARGLDLR
jgi:alkylation response protein AidB-like acyl-CoA dehydrogenase